MSEYNPENQTSRIDLAFEILARMAQTGFSHEIIPGTNEAVYSRPVENRPGVRILVYTSVEQGPLGPETRGVGTDAIRVCAVYRNKKGQDRGLVKAEARVNRTGKIEDIVARTHTRMREVWLAARKGETCKKCGAPLFKSKNGNLVCADACWSNT